MGVGDEARRVGADGDAGQQVADDWGKPGALGEVAEHERGGEASREGEDQIDRVHPSC